MGSDLLNQVKDYKQKTDAARVAAGQPTLGQSAGQMTQALLTQGQPNPFMQPGSTGPYNPTMLQQLMKLKRGY